MNCPMYYESYVSVLEALKKGDKMIYDYAGIPFPESVWEALKSSTKKDILKNFNQKSIHENFVGYPTPHLHVEMKLDVLSDLEMLKIKNTLVTFSAVRNLQKENDNLTEKNRELIEFKNSLKNIKKALGDL